MSGCIIDANPRAVEFFQFSRKEFCGENILRIILGAAPTLLQTIRENLGENRFTLIEAYCRRKDGSRMPTEISVGHLNLSGRDTYCFFVRNITARKLAEEELERHRNHLEELVRERTAELEDANRGLQREIADRQRIEAEKSLLQTQLLQAQKMEAIGRLAGGVAHDFNNLLTTIRGFTELTLKELPEDGQSHGNLIQIHKASDRAADLIRQLLLFSRREPITSEPICLNDTVKDLLTILERLLGEGITVQTDLDSKLWPTSANHGNVQQVLMNLAVNARDAMPDGCTLTISTSNRAIDDSQVRQNPEARPGQFACLAVRDTGTGMSSETVQQVFEPFFTTREAGRGSGLGLSVIYGIVKQHGGWIEVDSEMQAGSTFRVLLPAGPSHAAVVAPESGAGVSAATTPASQGEKILVVEDEPGVRVLAATVLRAAGYQIVEAETIAEATECFAAEPESFDLVFSDVVLPDGNGLQLLDKLAAYRSECPALLTSGYADGKSNRREIRERGLPFLDKPYRVDALLQRIRETLRTPSD